MKAQQTRISLVRDRMLQAQPFLEMMESATPFCFSISAETLTQLQQLFKDPRAMEEAVRVSMDLFHKKAHMSQGDLPGGDIAMLQGSDDFGILQVLILGLAGKMIDMPQAQAKGSLKSLQGSEGGGMPPDAFLALTTIDGQHIQQLIQVLFRIDVFNIAKDKDHQGQYLFFVNPAAFPQFLRQNFDTMERSQWGLGTARIIELLDLPVIQRLDWRPNLQVIPPYI